MTQPKTTIVIPTFWRGPVSEAPVCTLDSDFKYDHATPLDDDGTLGRALSSLKILGDDHEFTVAVVAASTRDEIKQAVEIKVRAIVAEFENDYPILFIGPDELVLWRRRLAETGMGKYDRFLKLDGYANIRNICLLAAVMTEADVAVLFDDDQVYEDPHYLDKALEFIGQEHEGDFVGGVAGYYRLPDDGFYLPPPQQEWQRLWGDIDSMNEAFRLIEQGPRLKKTPFAFGGNMIIHRRLFEKIPFDPAVPRGADNDYLINSKFFGYDFFLDNQLWIRHLPPPRCAPPWHRLRQDVVRFTREHAKLASADNVDGYRKVSPDELDPFPGRFLKGDLYDLVFNASMEMATSYITAGLEDDARECMVNIAISKAESQSHENAWAEYLEFKELWEEFVRVLPKLGIWAPENGLD